jgi:hypothetical protein
MCGQERDLSNGYKRTILKGFRQVLDYCLNFNEPSGFLVVYLNADIRYAIESADGFGGVKIGDNVVHVCVVDIFDHPTTASKRPIPNVVRVTASDFATPVAV